nr:MULTISPECIES: PAS domain-containing protein [Pseudofrankia]
MAAGLDALNLLDSLSEVVFRTDAEGCWTYLNPAWTRLTGFSIAESLGSQFISYVHPEEIEHTIALFMAVVVGGADHCHHETRYRIVDGTYRRVQIRAKVLRDDAGEVVGNMGTIIDVTDARFGAEMAGEQSALLELVPTGGKIDDLPVGVVIYDPDLTVLRASQVVDRLVGTRTQAGDPVDVLSTQLRPAAAGGPALGGEWGLVATARRTQQAQIGDLDVLDVLAGRADVAGGDDSATAAEDAGAGQPTAGQPTAGQPATGDAQLTSAGPVRSLRATVIPLRDEGGTRVAVVFSDITDLRRAERQQAALAYLGQRALTTLDVPALLNEAVELVASTLAVERCDLIECLEAASSASGRARGGPFGDTQEQAAAGSGGVVVTKATDADADVGPGTRLTGDVHAHVRACYGRVGGAWAAGAVSAAPGSYVSKVLSSRQPLVIDDLSGHADIAPEGWLQGDGTVATVGAPIGVGSRAFGVLAAHSGARRYFTKDEAHFVQSVANIVAASVELAQMQEDRARLAVFEDRDRIACELHDLVIQRLFSVGLRLQSLVRLVAEPGTGRLSAAIADLDQTIDEVRRTIFDLRPPYA